MNEEQILARLRADRGAYRVVALRSGVKYSTLTKIAAGATKAPYGRTLTALRNYYEQADAKAARRPRGKTSAR